MSEIEKYLESTRIFEVEKRFLNVLYETEDKEGILKHSDSSLLWKLINSEEEISTDLTKIFEGIKESIEKS